MTSEEISYISDGFNEVFSKLSSVQYRYVPYDVKRSVRSKTGNIDFVYTEEKAVLLYGKSDEKIVEDIVDPDTTGTGDSRIVKGIEFVRKTLADNSIIPKLRDAVDIPNESGIYERFIVVGFDRTVDLPEIFVKVVVTNKIAAFRSMIANG